MSESADFDPGPWKGHDFKDGRLFYDKHAGRSYDEAVNSGVNAQDLIPKSLTTNCKRPLIITVDVTGSMDEWPATIFSKLPYLEIEGREYLGEDMEISFSAVGDATVGDNYPLQIRPFTKGTDLKVQLGELKNEHGGGSGANESYELAPLYYARRVSMPNAKRPIHIIIGDELPYDFVSRSQARKFAYEDLRSDISTEEIFEEHKRRCAVYIIRKPYGNSTWEPRIQHRWIGLLGEDHVAPLADPNRVVDVIFGILAKETGRIGYFKGEIEGRQRVDQVDTVYKSLRTIHAVRASLPTEDQKPHTGRSIMLKPSDGDPSAPLI